ncbi:MAG: hypothetical protein R3E76_04970 [Planctomycetota bacterium]
MQKLMIAAAAILLTGVFGAFQVTGSDAQDAHKRVRTVEREENRIVIQKNGEVKEGPADGIVIETQGEDERVVYEVGEDGKWHVRRSVEREAPEPRGIFQMQRVMQPGQPGTWQIVSNEDEMILLNTATGATFMLDDNDDGLFWREIPRRGTERAMPRMPEMPDWRSERDQPNRTPEQIERRLNELRKRMKETRGDAREKMEKAIEELERALEKVGEARREEPRRERENEEANRERHADELEAQINELKEHIKDLSNEAEETDSRRRARELEGEIKEIKEMIGNLKKELKELRD